jgi:hypothetical protein
MPPAYSARLLLLLVAALLISCQDTTPRITRTVSAVEGFDLVFDDSAATSEFGLFGVGYAIKANFTYFTYRGKLYRSVGGGSVLITPIAASHAGYVVRETALSKDGSGNLNKSLLQILDKSNGEELARRGLVAHAIEDDTGWTGDHAMRFVRKVLIPERAPFGPRGLAQYEPAVATIQLEKSSDSTPYPLQEVLKGCPETIRVQRRPYSSTVVANTFEFLPHNPLQLVACHSGRILVASGVYASELSLDLLTFDGEHIAQGNVRLPLPSGANWADIPKVDLTSETIKVSLFVNSRSDWKSPFAALAKVHINATLHCHKFGCGSLNSR